ncbi:helix-turn-helix transcriptional regulator [Streptomyces galilaeus]
MQLPRRHVPEGLDGPGRPHLGRPPRRLHGDAHRHLPHARRDQRPPPGRAAAPALPPLRGLGVPAHPLLMEEMVRDEPAQEVVLDRLLDLLVIAALRAWFSRPEAEAPAWYRALADPVVGRALRLLQDAPAHPWTVASLAAKAAVSRAALARRFTDLVGEPPMSYLTVWRLALAADRLRDTDDTIAAIARDVGYGSAFALSSAFKRVYGVSPQEHRTRSA